jgi:methionyl-tRNA synthetase
VPTPGALGAADRTFLVQSESLHGRMRTALDEQLIHVALQHWYDVVIAANRYVDEQAPWALKKTDPARMATVLWVLAEGLRYLGLLAQPFMPDSAGRLLDQIAVSPASRSFNALGEQGSLVPGTPLPPPQGLFPRLVDTA